MVRDLTLPANCTLAAIIRKDGVVPVRAETILRQGAEGIAIVFEPGAGWFVTERVDSTRVSSFRSPNLAPRSTCRHPRFSVPLKLSSTLRPDKSSVAR